MSPEVGRTGHGRARLALATRARAPGCNQAPVIPVTGVNFRLRRLSPLRDSLAARRGRAGAPRGWCRGRERRSHGCTADGRGSGDVRVIGSGPAVVVSRSAVIPSRRRGICTRRALGVQIPRGARPERSERGSGRQGGESCRLRVDPRHPRHRRPPRPRRPSSRARPAAHPCPSAVPIRGIAVPPAAPAPRRGAYSSAMNGYL